MTIYKGTELLSSSAPIATTSQAGVVKPDGTTVTVTADGTISAQAGASALTDLTDVSISTPANDQVLKYNSTSQKWENGTSSGGVTDVQVNGTTVVTSGVANIPFVQGDTPGVCKVGNFNNSPNGVYENNGLLYLTFAQDVNIISRNISASAAIQPRTLDKAVELAMSAPEADETHTSGSAFPTTGTRENTYITAWTDAEKQRACVRIGAEQATQTQTITDASTITLANNTVYTASSALTSLTITYPASPATTFICKMSFTTGASMTFAVPSGTIMKGDDCSSSVFSPQASSSYVIMFSTDGTNNYGLVMKLS